MADTAILHRNNRLKHIKRISLGMICLVSVFIFVLVFFGSLLTITILIPDFLPDFSHEPLDLAGIERLPIDLSFFQRAGLAIVVAAVIGTSAGVCLEVCRLFYQFLKGNYFSKKCLSCIFSCGKWFFGLTVINLASNPLLSALMTWDLQAIKEKST